MPIEPEDANADASLDTNPIVSVDSAPIEFQDLVGTVLAVQANYYWVKLNPDATPEKPLLLCTRRSRLKKMGQRVMVGDRVGIAEPDWQGNRGAIDQVLPRCSELDRPPIANADQILLVFALAEPPIAPYQLSRFLVKAASTGLNLCLGLSKQDLVNDDEAQHWRDRLATWGYEPILVSVQQRSGFRDLQRQLDQKITIVSGPSGVGKSSLINYLIPKADLRVGAVSGKLTKGRHTTRHVELFELPSGGLLADTPGFNQPDFNCAPEALASYFPEARQKLLEARCQFNNCLHQNEPGCVVRGDWERYEHYLAFLQEAIAHQSALDQQSTPDQAFKSKTTDRGTQYEPRLATKKYRRESRRSRQQSLQGLKNDLEHLMDEDP